MYITQMVLYVDAEVMQVLLWGSQQVMEMYMWRWMQMMRGSYMDAVAGAVVAEYICCAQGMRSVSMKMQQ
jgi:hypothetical protein